MVLRVSPVRVHWSTLHSAGHTGSARGGGHPNTSLPLQQFSEWDLQLLLLTVIQLLGQRGQHSTTFRFKCGLRRFTENVSCLRLHFLSARCLTLGWRGLNPSILMTSPGGRGGLCPPGSGVAVPESAPVPVP